MPLCSTLPPMFVVIAEGKAPPAYTLQISRGLGAVLERRSWDELRIGRIPNAVLIDCSSPGSDHLRHLRAWAADGGFAISVVQVSDACGAADFVAELHALGYRYVLQNGSGGMARDEAAVTPIRAAARSMLDARSWIIPALAASAPGFEPEVLQVLELALPELPRSSTVNRLSRFARLGHRQGAARFCREHGLPRPKELFDRLRLALAVAIAVEGPCGLPLAEVARRAGYGGTTATKKRDTLRSQARRYTGRIFAELVAEGPASAFRPPPPCHRSVFGVDVSVLGQKLALENAAPMTAGPQSVIPHPWKSVKESAAVDVSKSGTSTSERRWDAC